MTVIVKCNPPTIGPHDQFSVEVPIFEEARPREAEEVFVWTAETRRGRGLAMRGVIESLDWYGRRVALRIRVVQKAPNRPLNVNELRDHRNDQSRAPLATLAGKLQTHAHNKVADLTRVEADFLRGYFDTP